jgi:DNA-binding protein HU-beta
VNNKEFIQDLSKRLDISASDAQDDVQKLIGVLTSQLQGENATISVQNFGVFEVKKKMERISVNPVTQQRMLVPPKLSLGFRPSPKLKEMFK